MTFSINELNSWNFIRWRSASGVTTGNLGSSTLATGTPSSYPNQNILNDCLYIPRMILDSQISVYANLNTPATDGDFANWVCVFADRFGNINSDHGTFTVTQDDFGSGNFRWYFTETPATADFDAYEYYRFVIYETSGNTVKYVSNFFQAVPATDAYLFSYLTYRNSSSLDNFNYTDLTSFRNRIAIDLNVIEDQQEIEITDYPEVTTGDVRSEKTYSKLSLTMQAMQFDYEARRAMESVFKCNAPDGVTLNGNTIQRKEAPTWEIDKKSRLADGLVKFYDQAASQINLAGYDG